ncbi:hypothetical protein Hdeb2414_s0006g00212051 [Helianthus debilis subsp. tardiflorus]
MLHKQMVKEVHSHSLMKYCVFLLVFFLKYCMKYWFVSININEIFLTLLFE